MDKIIKNTNKPLLLLYLLILQNKDEKCCNILRIFMNYHSNIFLNYNIFRLHIFDKKENSKKLLIEYYNSIKSQISILNKIKKFKTKFTNKFFWRYNLEEQICYLKKLNTKFLAIFECNKNIYPFHIKLELITNLKDINYFTNVIYERLTEVYKLFGFKFFKNNNLLLINELEFFDLGYVNKVNYLSYIYLKITCYLNKYIYLFELYFLNKKKIEIMINYKIKPLEVIVETFDSEIEYNDT